MVKIAVGQLTSTSNLLLNGQKAAKMVLEAARNGAEALFLPEACDYIAGSQAETISLAEKVDSSSFLKPIQAAQLSSSSPIYVSVGVHEPAQNHKVKNSLLWLDPKGKVANSYTKIHLFDVEVRNGPILKESKSVERGKAILEPFESPLGKIGSCICYDIRFPEMALKLRQLGAQVLLFPSAFTVPTGRAHWHTLSKARALDTQCYVINAAQVGHHDTEGKRMSYGHSLVVDPFGVVVAEAHEDTEQVIYADIDLGLLESVRERMPLFGPFREIL